MAMAHARQKERNRMFTNRKTRNAGDAVDAEIQKKSLWTKTFYILSEDVISSMMFHEPRCHNTIQFKLLTSLSPLYFLDIGYLMGIAHLKLGDKDRKSKNRRNRNTEEEGDFKLQKKCPYSDFYNCIKNPND